MTLFIAIKLHLRFMDKIDPVEKAQPASTRSSPREEKLPAVRKLEPQAINPHLWILTDIFGLTPLQIAGLTGVARRILIRGIQRPHYPLHPDVVRALRVLIRKCLAGVRPTKEPAPADWWKILSVENWRNRTVAMVDDVLARCNPELDKPKPPRETELSIALLATLGQGALRSRVIANMRKQWRTFQIDRAAKRLGVEEHKTVEGERFWLPPKTTYVPTPIAPPPSAIYVPPKTARRAQRIRVVLERLLVESPNGVAASDAVEHVMQRANCSRVQVYKAARDLCVLRETTGFGPRKRTVWKFPVVA